MKIWSLFQCGRSSVLTHPQSLHTYIYIHMYLKVLDHSRMPPIFNLRGFYVPSEPRAIFLPSNSSALLTWFCPGSLHWTWHVLCRLGLQATPYFVVPTTLNYRVLALVDLIYVFSIFEVDLSLASFSFASSCTSTLPFSW